MAQGLLYWRAGLPVVPGVPVVAGVASAVRFVAAGNVWYLDGGEPG